MFVVSSVERDLEWSSSVREQADEGVQERASDTTKPAETAPTSTRMRRPIGYRKGSDADHHAPDEPQLRESRPSKRRRRYVLGVLAVVLLLAAYPAWNAVGLWNDWRNVERESFDSDAFDQLPAVQAGAPLDEGVAEDAVVLPPTPAPPPSGPTDYQTFMIVGMDDSKLRADVIIMVMLPDDDTPPVMVSLPRDLYIPNRCTQSYTRINANFNGCGDINGPTALSGAIKDFTGYEIDHFALFTFEGFAEIIDQLGGFEICVDHPTREGSGRKFSIPAGCTLADGDATLEWVRSRKTKEYVDGRWRPVTNVSDLTRNERQQDLILTIFKGAAEFSTPQEMAAVAGSLADAFTLDDQLGMSAAIDLAWNNKDLDPNSMVRPKIPVTDHVTSGGAQVLIPTKTFQEVLDEALAE